MPRKKKDDNATDSSLQTAGDDKEAVDITASSNLPVYHTDERELVDDADSKQAGKRPVNIHVTARKGESVEQMLRRFNFAVTKSNLIDRLRDLQFYEKPSKKRQREEKLRFSQKRNYDD